MTAFDWSEIHERKTFSPGTVPLAFLSFMYGLGVKLRLTGYRAMKRHSLPGFVVSIGNLTVGGTGKTPATCTLAGWAQHEGYNVAVLSRGYRGQYKKKVLEVSDGNDINADPAEGGDEPYLLARKLRGVPVVISKDRYLAGLWAHKKYGTNFYILDDGFQHLALKRNLDLVLIDAESPLGNGHLLPWGPLREPVEHLQRADAFIITRSGLEESGHDPMGFLKGKFSEKPVFQSDHTPDQIVFPNKGRVYDPGSLKGKRAIAFAGIARPQVFRETLIRIGVEPIFFRGFRDHHAFNPTEIQDLIAKKEKLGADLLLTTEKDWVRMEDLGAEYPDLAYLRIEFWLLSGTDEFFRLVKERRG